MMKILIWEARTKKGWTLSKLASKTGMAISTLNDIENEKSYPRINQLEIFAKALDVKISDLYFSEYK